MPAFPIGSWKGGVDTRRSQLTSGANVLLQLDNAHINQGAEVEKRKAFVRRLLPAGTFGVQPTPTTIYVFGSSTNPGVIAPFTYQQLTVPSGASMTGVVCSTLFGNEPFVIATFSDLKTYAFYNGAYVPDFISGEANIFPDNAGIAGGFAALVQATGDYTSIYNNGGVGVDTFDTFSIPNSSGGNPYTATINVNSAAGTVSQSHISDGSASTAAGIANGSFQIVAGACDVLGILTTDGTNPVDTSTIVVGLITYTFKTTPAAGSSTALDVQIGATAAATLANLSMAICQSGTSGTTGTFNYYTGGVANTKATAMAVNGSAITINAIVSTSVAVSQSGTTHLTWSGLSGGATGNLAAGTANYVSSIKVGALEILGANITFAKDLTTTITNVVNQILSYSITHPDGGGNYFTASASGSTINLATNAGTATYNGAVITIVAHGMFFCDNCVFSITGTSFTCDYIRINDGTVNNTGIGIMSAVLTFPTNTEQISYFAQRIAQNVNAGSSGYLALATPGTGVIYISKQTTTTTDSLWAVSVSLTGVASGGGGTSGPLSGTFSPASLSVSDSGYSSGISLSNGSNTWILIQPLSITPSGGTPPYSYTYSLSLSATITAPAQGGGYFLSGPLTFGITSANVYVAASGWAPATAIDPPTPLTANASQSTIVVFLPNNSLFSSLYSYFHGSYTAAISATQPTVGAGAAWIIIKISFLLTIQVTDSAGSTGVIGAVPITFYVRFQG